MKLSHLDARGRARMVDVGLKPITQREAVACGEILIKREVIRAIWKRNIAKGDVLSVAKVAAILAAKRVGEIIPLCHALNLDCVDLHFGLKPDRISVRAQAKALGRTGVEMEALTAVSVACLTIYDMVKASDKSMTIGPIFLLEKKGGRSGHYVRSGDENGH